MQYIISAYVFIIIYKTFNIHSVYIILGKILLLTVCRFFWFAFCMFEGLRVCRVADLPDLPFMPLYLFAGLAVFCYAYFPDCMFFQFFGVPV